MYCTQSNLSLVETNIETNKEILNVAYENLMYELKDTLSRLSDSDKNNLISCYGEPVDEEVFSEDMQFSEAMLTFKRMAAFQEYGCVALGESSNADVESGINQWVNSTSPESIVYTPYFCEIDKQGLSTIKLKLSKQLIDMLVEVVSELDSLGKIKLSLSYELFWHLSSESLKIEARESSVSTESALATITLTKEYFHAIITELKKEESRNKSFAYSELSLLLKELCSHEDYA